MKAVESKRIEPILIIVNFMEWPSRHKVDTFPSHNKTLLFLFDLLLIQKANYVINSQKGATLRNIAR